jgi:hypothetical protein
MMLKGPNMIGVHKDLLLGLPNSPFSWFFWWLVLHFTFFFMSNEIILFQILHRPLKYLLFWIMKVKIINFIQCEPCSINCPKFLKIWFFETFNIAIEHLVLVTFIYFIHISTVVKILGQKKLFRHSLNESLNFFSSWDKVLIFFKDLIDILKLVQIWHYMHRIIPL